MRKVRNPTTGQTIGLAVAGAAVVAGVIYILTHKKVEFDLMPPVATPAVIKVGETVSISVPLISRSDKTVEVEVKVEIKEAGFGSRAGKTMQTVRPILKLEPGKEGTVTVRHIGTEGGPQNSSGIAMRHIDITTFVNNVVVGKTWEADNSFGVQVAGEALILAQKSFSFVVRALREGDAGHEGTELSRKSFSFVVRAPQAGDARPEGDELARQGFSFTVKQAPVIPPAIVYGFEFGSMTHVPTAPQLGSSVDISFTLTSRCSGDVDVTPMVVIYEHGAFGPGDQLGDPYQMPTERMSPNTQKIFSFTSTNISTLGSKDVVVYVWADGGNEDRAHNRYANAFTVETILPASGDIVTFSVWCDGLPFATGGYYIYYYDPDWNEWSDGVIHLPSDVVTFYSVPTGGQLSVIPYSSITGEWGTQKYSVRFTAENGVAYKYDYAGAGVYYV